MEIKLANVLKTLNFLGLQQSIRKESLFLLLLFFGINTVFFFHSSFPECMLLLISIGPPIHLALCFFVPELTTDLFMRYLRHCCSRARRIYDLCPKEVCWSTYSPKRWCLRISVSFHMGNNCLSQNNLAEPLTNLPHSYLPWRPAL